MMTPVQIPNSTLPLLAADTLHLPGIRHGFFTRRGGVSGGIYGSLNTGPGSDDDAASVAENRRLVAQAMGFAPGSLATLYQVHGREVVTLDGPLPPGERPQADGLVTNRPGLLLSILTADCAPVLLADADARVIGACHAGWKGALAGITDATVEAMVNLGAGRENIQAAIGPAIGWQNYEVDRAFRLRFIEAEPANESFFRSADHAGKWRFNIKGYVASRLMLAGVDSVDILAHDTYAEEADFFSYRRATHRGEVDYGRQLSVIGLR